MDYDIIAQTPEAELDKRLAVKFYKKAVKNNFKSRKEGKNVFDELEFISIRIPGDNTSVVHREVTEQDKKRFSVIWENYLKKEDDLQNGIPLEMLPSLSEAQIENLKSYRVYTIEQLAGLQESFMGKILGSRDMIKSAKKFLEGDSYAERLEKELQELKRKLSAIEEKTNEPSDNNSNGGGRNRLGRSPGKRGRKPRPLYEEVSSASDENREGAAIAS